MVCCYNSQLLAGPIDAKSPHAPAASHWNCMQLAPPRSNISISGPSPQLLLESQCLLTLWELVNTKRPISTMNEKNKWPVLWKCVLGNCVCVCDSSLWIS